MQSPFVIGEAHGVEKRIAWRIMAKSQGLVCLICGKVPAWERRPEFYDTGLCRGCAEELSDDPEVVA